MLYLSEVAKLQNAAVCQEDYFQTGDVPLLVAHLVDGVSYANCRTSWAVSRGHLRQTGELLVSSRNTDSRGYLQRRAQ